MDVSIAYATPLQQWELLLTVEDGCTAAWAIQRSGIVLKCPEIDLVKGKIGVYGRKVALDYPLRDGDRVEIYRALKISPKQARLRRAITLKNQKTI